jgi:integrase
MSASPRGPGHGPAVRRVVSDSLARAGSVRSGPKRWQPPDGLAPTEVQAVIEAAGSERDRLLLRVLWATGARISEVLALRPLDVQRDHLVLANRKNPSQPIKRVFLPAGPNLATGCLTHVCSIGGTPRPQRPTTLPPGPGSCQPVDSAPPQPTL